MDAFTFAGNPEIHFGPGIFSSLPGRIRVFGNKALILTGKTSLKQSGYHEYLEKELHKNKIAFHFGIVDGEPTPEWVDQTAERHRHDKPDVVVGIGGGSVMDAGKAVSAMIPVNGSVLRFLEGIGDRAHPGITLPFIAVPTSSGTGSEATKNAVLSRVDDNGFKKSLRHNNFIPEMALVDPELTLSLPPHITAACGMDALTQLLESFVSTQASPMTDALAREGIAAAGEALVPVSTDQGDNIGLRSKMSLAALLSGITLANAGLGTVHGFASSIGGRFPIPHGVVCGTLMGAVTRFNIKKLLNKEPESAGLRKYAVASRLMFGNKKPDSDARYAQWLAESLEEWTEMLKMPRLGEYGMNESDVDEIVASTGQKNNPVKLTNSELREILLSRL